MENGKPDAFEKWQKADKWLEVRKIIVEKSKLGYSQKRISECLGIKNEATFCRLKNRHPEIQEALDEADGYVLENCFTAMYKLAFGGTYTNQHVVIEKDPKTGKEKQKLYKDIREVEPNFNALAYVLGQRFGEKYSVKREELQLMREKMNATKGEWKNADVKEEDSDSGE